MPLPSDFIRLTSVCRFPDGQNAVNVTHWAVSADTTPAGTTWSTAAEAFAQRLAMDYPGLLSAEASFEGCYANSMRAPQPISGKSSMAAVAGTLLNPCMPSQLAKVVSLTPDNPVFTRKGRVYFPAGVEGQTNADTSLKAGIIAPLNTLVGNWIAGYTFMVGANSFTASMILYSKKYDDVAFIVAHRVDKYHGTQRRRSGLNSGDSPF